jgi:hypothetical protein
MRKQMVELPDRQLAARQQLIWIQLDIDSVDHTLAIAYSCADGPADSERAVLVSKVAQDLVTILEDSDPSARSGSAHRKRELR